MLNIKPSKRLIKHYNNVNEIDFVLSYIFMRVTKFVMYIHCKNVLCKMFYHCLVEINK